MVCRSDAGSVAASDLVDREERERDGAPTTLVYSASVASSPSAVVMALNSARRLLRHRADTGSLAPGGPVVRQEVACLRPSTT